MSLWEGRTFTYQATKSQSACSIHSRHGPHIQRAYRKLFVVNCGVADDKTIILCQRDGRCMVTPTKDAMPLDFITESIRLCEGCGSHDLSEGLTTVERQSAKGELPRQEDPGCAIDPRKDTDMKGQRVSIP